MGLIFAVDELTTKTMKIGSFEKFSTILYTLHNIITLARMPHPVRFWQFPDCQQVAYRMHEIIHKNFMMYVH